MQSHPSIQQFWEQHPEPLSSRDLDLARQDPQFPPLQNQRLLQVCQKKPVDRVPMWLMRQAGRYLPEFQEVRKDHSFFEVCENPYLACLVTLQPLLRFDLDAAIIFSDILVVPRAMGLEVRMEEKKGPVFQDPLKTPEDLARLVTPETGALDYVYNAIYLTRKELKGKVPLLGFCGAPWTLFTYMTEGQSTKLFAEVKKWVFRYPQETHSVLQKLTDVLIEFLKGQIRAGAQGVQIFDSFAGEISNRFHEKFSMQYIRQITKAIKEAYPDVPVIVFCKGLQDLEPVFKDKHTDVVAIDYTQDVQKVALLAKSYSKVLQGNMDPGVLLGNSIKEEVDYIWEAWKDIPFIFNLGHGMWPVHKPEQVEELTKNVQNIMKF